MRNRGIEDASAGEMERFHRRTRELFENLNQDLLNLELSFEQQADFTYLMDAMATNLRALRGIAEGQIWKDMLKVINEFLDLVSSVQNEHVQMRDDTMDTLFEGYDTLQMLHACQVKTSAPDTSLLEGWREKFSHTMATSKPPTLMPYDMDDDEVVIEDALPPIEEDGAIDMEKDVHAGLTIEEDLSLMAPPSDDQVQEQELPSIEEDLVSSLDIPDDALLEVELPVSEEDEPPSEAVELVVEDAPDAALAGAEVSEEEETPPPVETESPESFSEEAEIIEETISPIEEAEAVQETLSPPVPPMLDDDVVGFPEEPSIPVEEPQAADSELPSSLSEPEVVESASVDEAPNWDTPVSEPVEVSELPEARAPEETSGSVEVPVAETPAPEGTSEPIFEEVIVSTEAEETIGASVESAENVVPCDIPPPVQEVCVSAEWVETLPSSEPQDAVVEVHVDEVPDSETPEVTVAQDRPLPDAQACAEESLLEELEQTLKRMQDLMSDVSQVMSEIRKRRESRS